MCGFAYAGRGRSCPGPSHRRISPARGNTVYLRGHDWAAVQRWGVAVVGVFELVVRHFAFDDSRVGARAARGEQLMEDFGGDTDFGVADHLRGKNQGGLQWFGGLPEVIG